MNHEKAIEEAATNIEGISNLPDGCEPLRIYLRALAETIQRAESQRVETLIPQPVEPAAEKIGEQQSTLSVKDLLALDAEIHSLLASLAQQQSDSFSQSGLKVSQVQMLAALIRSFGKVEPAASETPETTSELAREIKSIRGLTEIDHTQQVEAVIQAALDAQAAQYQSQLTDLRDRVQKLENALNGLRNAWSHPHEEINTFIDKALKP